MERDWSTACAAARTVFDCERESLYVHLLVNDLDGIEAVLFDPSTVPDALAADPRWSQFVRSSDELDRCERQRDAAYAAAVEPHRKRFADAVARFTGPAMTQDRAANYRDALAECDAQVAAAQARFWPPTMKVPAGWEGPPPWSRVTTVAAVAIYLEIALEKHFILSLCGAPMSHRRLRDAMSDWRNGMRLVKDLGLGDPPAWPGIGDAEDEAQSRLEHLLAWVQSRIIADHCGGPANDCPAPHVRSRRQKRGERPTVRSR